MIKSSRAAKKRGPIVTCTVQKIRHITENGAESGNHSPEFLKVIENMQMLSFNFFTQHD